MAPRNKSGGDDYSVELGLSWRAAAGRPHNHRRANLSLRARNSPKAVPKRHAARPLSEIGTEKSPKSRKNGPTALAPLLQLPPQVRTLGSVASEGIAKWFVVFPRTAAAAVARARVVRPSRTSRTRATSHTPRSPRSPRSRTARAARAGRTLEGAGPDDTPAPQVIYRVSPLAGWPDFHFWPDFGPVFSILQRHHHGIRIAARRRPLAGRDPAIDGEALVGARTRTGDGGAIGCAVPPGHAAAIV